MGKLTMQDKLNIIKLAKSGETCSNLAQLYNVSSTTVSRLLDRDKYGGSLEEECSRKKMSEDELHDLINDLKNRSETKCTITSLAVKYNTAESNIYKIAKKNNINLNLNRNRLTDEQKKYIYEQYNSGVRAVELSKKFNIGIETIYKTINKFKKSDEDDDSTTKLLAEQFNSEMNDVVDHTFITDIDKDLLSEPVVKLLEEIEDKKKALFEKYKEYSIELIAYTECMDNVSSLVKAELEEKYKYLQSKFERVVA